jgi:trehalose 6-phosphate phosphatase
MDGTLLEFALEPSAVRVTDRLQSILDQLSSATEGAIAFVSGRTLADLDRLLGPKRFPLAAVHGLERRSADGTVTKAGADLEEFECVHERLVRVASEFPLTSIEHKGLTLALHYRRCPEHEAVLIERVEAGLAGLHSDFVLMRGKMVLEIKPSSGDKGSAIASFMREPPFVGRTPVFIGDDVTDEAGFRIVNELGGISVKVDAGPSVASYRLPNIGAVLDWLEKLVADT